MCIIIIVMMIYGIDSSGHQQWASQDSSVGAAQCVVLVLCPWLSACNGRTRQLQGDLIIACCNYLLYVCVQRIKGHGYRFSLLIQELRSCETEEYCACVLAFINCILSGAKDLTGRVKLRNELIGTCTAHVVLC